MLVRMDNGIFEVDRIVIKESEGMFVNADLQEKAVNKYSVVCILPTGPFTSHKGLTKESADKVIDAMQIQLIEHGVVDIRPSAAKPEVKIPEKVFAKAKR